MFNALLWNLLLTAGLAMLLAVLCRLPSLHKRPALRCWLWLLLMIKLITPPLVDVPLLPAVAAEKAVVHEKIASKEPVLPPSDLAHDELVSLPYFPSGSMPETVFSEESSPSVQVDEEPTVISAPSENAALSSPKPNSWTLYLGGLAAVSLIGTTLFLVTSIVRSMHLNRWLRQACRDDARLAQTCAEVAANLGMRQSVRNAVVDVRATPLLWGWRRPMVVLSRQLMDELAPESIRNIVAHELAHLLRHDTWANVFAFLVKSLLWWNPVVWWAERELRAAQELCCDAIAIDCCNANRRSYATTLLQALDFIQDEPITQTPHALASRMGSRRSILRRFEMIAEKPLSYQLSRRTLWGLLILSLPLLCMPVRAQVKEPEPPAKPEATVENTVEPTVENTTEESTVPPEGKDELATKATTLAETLSSPAVEAELQGKAPKPGTELDPEVKALGERVRKQLTTYSDQETFTLKDGETVRMKLKENITPVAELLITPHFVEGGTRFDLAGLDSDGEKIQGTQTTSAVIRNGRSLGTGLGKHFQIDGENIMSIISMSSNRSDDKAVTVNIKLLFTRIPTREELDAMLLLHGDDGRVQVDFQKIGRWVDFHKHTTGHYPQILQELGESLPKDFYSPTGEDYHYQATRTKYMLSSCGKDGIYGNGDDNIYLSDSRAGVTRSGHRSGMEPFEEDDDPDTLDSETEALGETVRNRLETFPNVATMTLEDGQTGRIKVKKNITPVAEVLITVHLLDDCTKYDIKGLDTNGKAVERFDATVQFSLDDNDQGLNMGAPSSTGKEALAKFKLTPLRQEDKTVQLKVEVLFAHIPTAKERRAMLLVGGKDGNVKLDIEKIIDWIEEYQHKTGHYPEHLKDLGKNLPKDAFSPNGEDYYYEAHPNRFLLRSCGKDGIQGTEDDQEEIRPLRVVDTQSTDGKTTVGMMTKGENVNKQSEHSLGERPRGNCSISGKVVSAETGEPIGHARMYLHYNINHGSIFINVASDGTFHFKDIPQGPFSLTVSHVAGYQDTPYNPDGKPGPYPPFSLKEGEQRSGIVLKAKRSYCISGKVLGENGKAPEQDPQKPLLIAAWHKDDDGKVTFLEQGFINREDGSYVIDGLDGKPVYVSLFNWDVLQKKWDGYPPIYYPGTFFRDEAKQITFDKNRMVENINLTLKTKGGLTVEGTVLDESGKPVPEAVVAIHCSDFPVNLMCAYTDAQGKYRLSCIGSGEFHLQAEAVHRGFIRARKTIQLDRATPKTQHDFTLQRGINISGKFVDEAGKDWQIAKSYGRAEIVEDLPQTISKSIWITGAENRYNTKNVADSSSSSSSPLIDGRGKYPVAPMLFPSKNTFIIQGMMPGETKIDFEPKKEGEKVLKILYQGKDILESGIKTEPGQDLEGVTIVIGKP